MAGICDVPIISNVCETVGETAATLISAPFDWLAQAIGQAASWPFQGVWALFDSTTLVDITGANYIGVYNIMFGISIFLMLIFFCLQLITGLVRGDTMGTLICADFECSANVRTPPKPTAMYPDPQVIVDRQVTGLQERTAQFINRISAG